MITADELEQVSAILGTIYDTILAKSSWQDVLEQTCALLAAEAGSIIFLDPVGQRAAYAFEHGTDPKYSELFLTYGSANPFMLSVLLAPVGEVAKPLELVGRQAISKERFYKEWCEPQNYGDFIGGLVARRDRQFATFSFVRLTHEPLFDEREDRLLRLIVPHVVRSLTIAEAFDEVVTEKHAYLDTLDLLRSPAMLVRSDMSVAYVNPAGQNLVREQDGAIARLADGRLVLNDKQIFSAVRSAVASDSGARMFMLGDPPHTSISIVPIKSSQLSALPVADATSAIFFSSATANLPPPAQPLVDAFGLTPAELRILILLLEGRTPNAIADDIGVGIATVRTHIASLLAKTGSVRQQDMIAKVAALMPPIGALPN
ncbi:helix-turn-helix transcriptional regulator [Devosia sp. 2618]|uniref:helix-turn-helix transcriptional regulator n=1 Tax=Devosia sp. 2618 TaxID=3156454 RepID=UPI003397E755